MNIICDKNLKCLDRKTLAKVKVEHLIEFSILILFFFCSTFLYFWDLLPKGVIYTRCSRKKTCGKTNGILFLGKLNIKLNLQLIMLHLEITLNTRSFSTLHHPFLFPSLVSSSFSVPPFL